LLAEEGVGYLYEQTGPVPGVFFAATCAPVSKVQENRKGLLQNLVGAVALDVHDEAHATCVVLEPWIVEALLWGTMVTHPYPPLSSYGFSRNHEGSFHSQRDCSHSNALKTNRSHRNDTASP